MKTAPAPKAADCRTIEELQAIGFRLIESYEIEFEREDALLFGPDEKLYGLKRHKVRPLSVPESVEFVIDRNEDSSGGNGNHEARYEWLRMVLAWKGDK